MMETYDTTTAPNAVPVAPGGEAEEAAAAADAAAQAARPDDRRSTMPDPASSACCDGDLMAQLAILLARLALSDRGHSRESARLEEERIRREGALRIAAMRDQADALLWSGVLRGAGEIASGAAQVYGACAAGDPAGGEAEGSEESEGGESAVDPGRAAIGAGAIVKGGADVWAAAYAADAGSFEADAAEHESDGAAAGRRLQEDREQMGDARELFDRALAFMREVDQIRRATLLAAARV